jgi:hypothetical protein
MFSLSRMMFAVVLLLPGGFLAAPLLWLARRWRQRRLSLLASDGAQGWAASSPAAAGSMASPSGIAR